MKNLIDQYLYEIKILERNLDTKRQVQMAENNKELEMIMARETTLEALKEKAEKVMGV